MNTWDFLAKQMIWKQLGNINSKKILDFGSGYGFTADYFSAQNEVIALEPSIECLKNRSQFHNYTQIQGNEKTLTEFKSNSFDLILCHNVLEYIDNQEQVISELFRLLKHNGYLSIVKHNRAGRIMQMAVLLNNFEEAQNLLNGNNSFAELYGQIRYYEDADISKWAPKLKLKNKYGIRTFWDLQQNQEIQTTDDWQKQMLQLEQIVSQNETFYNIAFFHHLIFLK